MKKSSAIYSIFAQKCPRCHTGDLFEARTYNLKKFQKMHKSCSCCRQPFFLEPMFYEGAQYVSYALQVALFVTFFVAYRVLFNEFHLTPFITSLAITSVLMIPFNWRISRVIWIHFFVRYHGECETETST